MQSNVIRGNQFAKEINFLNKNDNTKRGYYANLFFRIATFQNFDLGKLNYFKIT